MHPCTHLLLTTLAAVALNRQWGPRVLAFWAGGILADSDHLLWHAQQADRLDVRAAWAYFTSARQGARPAETLLLHRWPVILAGLACAPVLPRIGALAAGLAFHRLLDDLADRSNPWLYARRVRRRATLHRAVFRRAGYRCEACGAVGKLAAHHRVQREAGGRDTLANLVALCVTCHDRAHNRLTPAA
ncbi:MAG: hypothetical protein AUK03_16705 [Anaerolineae bacterium CG2_30_64_16]|nr:MAG: hypothetical protein AUK03_16705 [Anaerolineae bacterium CG2_30_64_16]